MVEAGVVVVSCRVSCAADVIETSPVGVCVGVNRH